MRSGLWWIAAWLLAPVVPLVPLAPVVPLASLAAVAAGAETAEPSMARASVWERVCANALVPEEVARTADVLPVGCWKDFGAFGGPVEVDGRRVAYLPILAWRQDHDTPVRRALVPVLWRTRAIARRPGTTADDVLDAVSLERLAARLRREAEAGRLAPGTLFLLGVEPGSGPADDRAPEAIARDARRLRALLDDLGRGYRLGLGGIRTPDAPWTREAYGGRSGLAFLRAVLDAAGDVRFDAFTIHPYPSDPARPAAEDSLAQVRAFRAELARRGLRDRPLVVGEIGTPFAATPAAAAERFAREASEALLAARDAAIGHPGDDDRLVQRLTWTMVAPPRFALPGYTDDPALDLARSALSDPDGRLTAVGRAFRAGVEAAR